MNLPASDRSAPMIPSTPTAPTRRSWQSVGLLFLLLTFSGRALAQTEVVVNFEKGQITGRWIDSFEEKGVIFSPAHAPTPGSSRCPAGRRRGS